MLKELEEGLTVLTSEQRSKFPRMKELEDQRDSAIALLKAEMSKNKNSSLLGDEKTKERNIGSLQALMNVLPSLSDSFKSSIYKHYRFEDSRYVVETESLYHQTNFRFYSLSDKEIELPMSKSVEIPYDHMVFEAVRFIPFDNRKIPRIKQSEALKLANEERVVAPKYYRAASNLPSTKMILSGCLTHSTANCGAFCLYNISSAALSDEEAFIFMASIARMEGKNMIILNDYVGGNADHLASKASLFYKKNEDRAFDIMDSTVLNLEGAYSDYYRFSVHKSEPVTNVNSGNEIMTITACFHIREDD